MPPASHPSRSGHPPAAAPATQPHRPGRWATVARAGAGAVALAALAVVALGLPAPNSRRTPPPNPVATRPAPAARALLPRPALSFTVQQAGVIALEPGGAPRARRAAREIGRVLSGFFDAAFFDPRWWETGPPAQAWAVFAPPARRAARADGSFGLGELGPLVSALAPTRAALRVELLTGPGGRPLAATADFVLRGRGELASGTPVALESRGVLLLRPVGGRWAVVGFPRVATSLREAPVRPASPSTPGLGATP
ncbi:MAG TPA: hypothetical protein VNO34_01690 [Actinomycetota bacterium]|nr:hypothetical protein [Actinomycetota bacterium]